MEAPAADAPLRQAFHRSGLAPPPHARGAVAHGRRPGPRSGRAASSSGSLALLADAAHMFTDVAALTLAWAGMALGDRAPTRRHTFGLARAEVLAAFVNAQLLILAGAWILWEAWRRFQAPAPVQTGLMLWVAAVGLVANLVALGLLKAGRRDSLNLRAAYLEVVDRRPRARSRSSWGPWSCRGRAGSLWTRCSRRRSRSSSCPGRSASCARRRTSSWRARRPRSTSPGCGTRSGPSRASRRCTTCTSGR